MDAEEIATFNVDFKESSPHETLLIQCLIVKPSTQFKVLGAVNQQVIILFFSASKIARREGYGVISPFLKMEN